MRKIVIILLFFLEAFIIFDTLFIEERSIRLREFTGAEYTEDSRSVVLSIDQDKAKEAYDVLSRLSDQHGANIIASRLKHDEEGDVYTKYVYITRPEFFQGFTYESYQVYPDNHSAQFLSSRLTNDPMQTGLMAGFTQDIVIEIRTLYEMMDAPGALSGTYTIQIDSERFDIFCDVFYQETGIVVQETHSIGGSGYGENPYPTLLMSLIFLHLVMILIVVYDFVKDSKSIAVEKIMGIKSSSVWGRRVFRLVRNQVAVVLLTFAILWFFYIKVMNAFVISFMQRLALAGILVISSTLVFSIVTFIVIANVSITGMLKRLRPLRFVNVFNMLAKITLMVLVIFLGHNALIQYAAVSNFHEERYADWEKARELYIIPSLNGTIEELTSAEFYHNLQGLYARFNNNGAILAQFFIFSPQFRSVNDNIVPYESAIVNPNYLKEFPVFDSHGEIVEISEEAIEMILLVPEAFRAEENQIREYYAEYQKGARGEAWVTQAGIYKEDQNLILIWVKNGQQYFTFDVTINPDDGNRISNSVDNPDSDLFVGNCILAVLTEKNGVPFEYDMTMGMGLDSLKIKTHSMDPESEIREILRRQGLENNAGDIVALYDVIAQEVEVSLETIRMTLFAIGVLLLTVFAIIIQSIYNYFDKNQKLICIRTFLGHSPLQKYGQYFLVWVVAAWAVIIIVSAILNASAMSNALLLALSLLSAELVVSLLTIFMIQKKRILDTLKGGI